MSEPHLKNESRELLCDTVALAWKEIEREGAHRPFCLATDRDGQRIHLASADRDEDDSARLETLLESVRSACARRDYRAVAVSRHRVVVGAHGELQNAIQVTLEHAGDEPAITCFVPYRLDQQNCLTPGAVFAAEAAQSFYPRHLPAATAC